MFSSRKQRIVSDPKIIIRVLRFTKTAKGDNSDDMRSGEKTVILIK